MNIWTAFFLVVSMVILASPLLSSSAAVRSVSDNGKNHDGRQDLPEYSEDNELELDLASGRLTEEDYEIMTGRKAKSAAQPAQRAEEDDGSLPEG